MRAVGGPGREPGAGRFGVRLGAHVAHERRPRSPTWRRRGRAVGQLAVVRFGAWAGYTGTEPDAVATDAYYVVHVGGGKAAIQPPASSISEINSIHDPGRFM